MLFLNVDFSKGMTTLLKESFKFKKYKALHPFFAVVVGLCQLPYVLISFLTAAAIYVFDFIVGVLAYPFEQIHLYCAVWYLSGTLCNRADVYFAL